MIQLKGDLWCECHLHMDGNKQDGKWLFAEHKALKWVKANNAPPKDHLDNSHGKWDDCDITFMITTIV
jgi:hypothetical protein